MKQEQRVITYVPQEGDQPAADMGSIRRGLWLYTHKLGLNFSLVLLLALSYQGFVAAFISLRGIRTLPILAKIPNEPLPQALGILAALVIGFIIQGLIIAEMAQVVWLRHPDRLKVRLMSGSVWWWIMLAALIVTISVDFFLLFLSVTGANSFGEAWSSIFNNQMTFATNLLLGILNFLTLLRCASVMRTTTSEEIRQEVEERLKAIAEEILIDAGDSARAKAAQVWKKLSVNPQRFVPIHDSVLNLISSQHPELIPPKLGGDSWAYDFGGNTFAALPPDLHQALLQSRHRAFTPGRKFLDEEQGQLWKLQPNDMAEVISYNMETYGKPRFVDVTDPETPRFMTRPVEFSALLSDPSYKGSAGLPLSQAPPAAKVLSLPDDLANRLSPTEKALFGAYLANTVFPGVHHSPFPQLPDLNIFQVFDSVELQWYYREWQKQTLQRAGA